MTDSKYIVEKVGSLFRRYGIKSITMDDVAREMGMSKKTLYQIVADKKELIHLVIKSDYKDIKDGLVQVRNEKGDAIIQLIRIQRFIREFLNRLSLAVDYDLRKYYSEIYDEIREEYLNLFRETISENINQGIAQGLYRIDVDIEVITKFHLNQIDQIPYSALISIDEFTSEHFVQEICMYHLNGLVNEKGRKLINNYKHEIEKIKKPEVI